MQEKLDQQEANKRTAQQIYDVWDGGDEGAIDDVMAEDVVLNKPDAVGGPVRGREAYKDNLRMVREGFPDLFFRAHEVVAEDDKVIAYCTFGGTHEGRMLGIEPTGTSVEVWDFVMYRFDDGKVVEVTSLPDLLGLFLEVGAIEPPGGMSTEAKNKEIAQQYAKEIISNGNLDLVDEIFADDYVEYNSALPEPIQGPEAVREYVSMLRTAVPDINCGVEDLIAEGDMVVRRDRATGTHEGEFMGVEGTGKEAVVEGHHIHRIEDGKLIESWAQNDMLGFLQQIGVIELAGGAE